MADRREDARRMPCTDHCGDRGDVVRLYYPRWHRAAAAATPSD